MRKAPRASFGVPARRPGEVCRERLSRLRASHFFSGDFVVYPSAPAGNLTGGDVTSIVFHDRGTEVADNTATRVTTALDPSRSMNVDARAKQSNSCDRESL